MILSESHVDNAVHAALEELKKAGVSFDSDEYCIFNERLTEFLTDECQMDVVESVTFNDLKDDQWMSWMELAREAQIDRGDDPETISSEDTEKEAEHLFGLHDGYLPVSETTSASTADFDKIAKAYAANFLFDLESGDRNHDVAKVLPPEGIFDAVILSSSLNIHVNAVGYELEPYWPFLSEDNALEILEDARTAIESVLKRLSTGCNAKSVTDASSKDLWLNDDIQFPRLLAEIGATVDISEQS